MTRVVTLSDSSIIEAAEAVGDGGIVALPSPRWYMLCCDAANAGRVKMIHAAKQRSLDRPLLIVVPGVDSLRALFRVGAHTDRLIEKLLPGELALALRWASEDQRRRYLSGSEDETLVCHPCGVLGEIAKRVGRPVAATSASISTTSDSARPGPAIYADEAQRFITETALDAALVVDGGICPAYLPTTIVDCREPTARPKILRKGFVHERAIATALGEETE